MWAEAHKRAHDAAVGARGQSFDGESALFKDVAQPATRMEWRASILHERRQQVSAQDRRELSGGVLGGGILGGGADGHGDGDERVSSCGLKWGRRHDRGALFAACMQPAPIEAEETRHLLADCALDAFQTICGRHGQRGQRKGEAHAHCGRVVPIDIAHSMPIGAEHGTRRCLATLVSKPSPPRGHGVRACVLSPLSAPRADQLLPRGENEAAQPTRAKAGMPSRECPAHPRLNGNHGGALRLKLPPDRRRRAEQFLHTLRCASKARDLYTMDEGGSLDTAYLVAL